MFEFEGFVIPPETYPIMLPYTNGKQMSKADLQMKQIVPWQNVQSWWKDIQDILGVKKKEKKSSKIAEWYYIAVNLFNCAEIRIISY